MALDTETTVMGRIRRDVETDGGPCWTLFDSGARNSYIARDAVRGMDVSVLTVPTPIQLGGGKRVIGEVCNVQARLDGHPLHFQAGVLDEIGQDESGREIDLLFGAIAMQNWGIGLDLKNEQLDFSHFATEFLEF